MAKFFKWMLISILVLISLPILLVGFILVGMGIIAIHDEYKEKNQPSQSIRKKYIPMVVTQLFHLATRDFQLKKVFGMEKPQNV